MDVQSGSVFLSRPPKGKESILYPVHKPRSFVINHWQPGERVFRSYCRTSETSSTHVFPSQSPAPNEVPSAADALKQIFAGLPAIATSDKGPWISDFRALRLKTLTMPPRRVLRNLTKPPTLGVARGPIDPALKGCSLNFELPFFH